MDEIVCVDTGSTDDTPAVAERFGARVLLSRWRGDISFHHGEALEASTCDWVLFIDADEWLTNPTALRPAVESAAAAYTVDALLARVNPMTGALTADADGRLGVRCWSARLFRRSEAYDECPVGIRLRVMRGVGVSPLVLGADSCGIVEGELARSIPRLHRMLEAGTDDAHAHFHLARWSLVAGRLDDALKHARAAEPLVGDGAQFVPLWLWMFDAALAIEGLGPAAAALRRGLERHPGDRELHRTALLSALLRRNGGDGLNPAAQDCNDGLLGWTQLTVGSTPLASPSYGRVDDAVVGPPWVRLRFVTR